MIHEKIELSATALADVLQRFLNHVEEEEGAGLVLAFARTEDWAFTFQRRNGLLDCTFQLRKHGAEEWAERQGFKPVGEVRHMRNPFTGQDVQILPPVKLEQKTPSEVAAVLLSAAAELEQFEDREAVIVSQYMNPDRWPKDGPDLS